MSGCIYRTEDGKHGTGGLTMSEYIDREETVNALDRLCDRVCQYSKRQRWVMCGACPLGDAFDVIMDNIPAADVAPVRRGRWNVGTWGWECSECAIESNNTYPVCPYCGARMDGGDGNGKE